ncbi:MAG: hypothetical protein EBS21_07170 [Sphingomonadaceae bacterium]|nr:hypothetical protein [Sphingomonadaceae bacterium]
MPETMAKLAAICSTLDASDPAGETQPSVAAIAGISMKPELISRARRVSPDVGSMTLDWMP